VVGDGKLVGTPTIAWLDTQEINYTMINKETDIIVQRDLMKEADIIISGVGVPHLINEHQVKDGVVIIDAGTSEAGKRIRGDVSPSVAHKASVFTPVPGGIGPLTIAILYRNVVSSYLYD
jgi:methylenetetrahydrofolate dehydrogenase (NADP+)/methenyltetrahydrofolate cyclohydrolase